MTQSAQITDQGDGGGFQEGEETRINTTTVDDQYRASATSFSSGEYLITWASNKQDGSGWGIYAQRFDAGGQPLGVEARVNSTTLNHQSDQSAVALSDGGYVVAWESYKQDGSGWGIYQQVYDSAGVRIGGELQVNATTAGDQIHPSLAALSDGSYVVTWTSQDQDGSGYGVYAQHYASDGAAIDSETRVNTTTEGDQSFASAARLAGGGYVVTWISQDQDRSGAGIYAQRYDALGVAQGMETHISTATAGDQSSPAVAGLRDGGYAIAWVSNDQDGSGDGIYVQRFGSDGTAFGGETRVNAYVEGDQYEPSIVGLADGGFLVGWTSDGQDGSGTGIYAQRYDRLGSPVDGQVLLNTATAGDQSAPSLSALPHGGYLAAWASDGQDGSGYGIYSKLFTALNSVPVAVDDAGAMTEDEIGTFDVRANDALDSDEGASNTITVTSFDVSGPSGASLGTPGVTVVDDQIRIDPENAFNDLIAGEHATLTVAYTIHGDQADDRSTATLTATILGQDETLVGDDFANVLSGGRGADSLFGNGGDDVLAGKGGADSVDGGPGYDTANYAESDAAVTVDLLAGSGLGGQAEGDVLISIENLTGSNFSDALAGNDGDNVLVGGAGADTLKGGLGNDTADYSASGARITLDLHTIVDGTVRAYGGDGAGDKLSSIENVVGSSFSDKLTGDAGANRLVGGAGSDILNGLGGADSMDGGSGNDTYYVDDPGDVVTDIADASGGADLVNSALSYALSDGVENLTLTGTADLNGTGNSAANYITGNDGDNVLVGGAGADTLKGGLGNDTADYSASSAGITLDLHTIVDGTARAYGGDGASDKLSSIENVVGSSFSDKLTGDAGANRLVGGAGTDILNGLGGADSMDGGSGNDTYYVDDPGDVVTDIADASGGTDLVNSALSYALSDWIENLMLTGTADLDGTGNSAANYVTGNDGDNVLVGGAGADTLKGGLGNDTADYSGSDAAVTVDLHRSISGSARPSGGHAGGDQLFSFENVVGSSFSDKLTGDAGANHLVGGAGSDILNGLGGADSMDGGSGNDTYYVDDPGDVVTDIADASGGTDLVNSAVSYALSDGVENLALTGTADLNGTGNSAANYITGNDGDNVLVGGAGADTLKGGLGNDTADYSASGAGITLDLHTIVDGTARAYGGDGASDKLSSIENVIGSEFSDKLIGDAGANRLVGGAGSDILNGLGGTDDLMGGPGADQFVFGSSNDSGLDAARDVIGDFASGDIISLKAIDADVTAGHDGDQFFTFIGDAALTGAGQLHAFLDGNGNTVLEANTDADISTPEFQIELHGFTGVLAASDFLL